MASPTAPTRRAAARARPGFATAVDPFAPISREGALVLNNLFLAASAAAVFIGTLYPLALEALTGEAARKYMAEQERSLREIAAALKVPPAEAAARVAALVEERRKLEKDLADARKKLAMGGGAQSAAAAPADRVAPSSRC